MENNFPTGNILSIDIGGSSVKAAVLDQQGNMLQDFIKVKTPRPAEPDKVLDAIKSLTKDFHGYEMVSVGFPGFVRKGIVFTAPNLGTQLWKNVNLNKLISDVLNKPVRIVNDADLHGLGVVSEKGLELVITLGTGFGTALLLNGNLLPHLELAHLPVRKSKTYDDFVGDRGLIKAGLEKWNNRIKDLIGHLKTVFNYDRLYIGGGNADKINFKLDDNITLIKNKDGIKGGARLWQLDEDIFMKSHFNA